VEAVCFIASWPPRTRQTRDSTVVWNRERWRRGRPISQTRCGPERRRCAVVIWKAPNFEGLRTACCIRQLIHSGGCSLVSSNSSWFGRCQPDDSVSSDLINSELPFGQFEWMIDKAAVGREPSGAAQLPEDYRTAELIALKKFNADASAPNALESSRTELGHLLRPSHSCVVRSAGCPPRTRMSPGGIGSSAEWARQQALDALRPASQLEFVDARDCNHHRRDWVGDAAHPLAGLEAVGHPDCRWTGTDRRLYMAPEMFSQGS
jgi:hypothetical protein